MTINPGSPKPLIEKLARSLREVIDDLQKKIMPPPSVEISNKSTQPIDMELLNALLQAVQTQAEEMDPDMEDKAEELNQLLERHGNTNKALGARLADQAANLDFEEALETLSELREAFTHNTLLSPGDGDQPISNKNEK